jgi:hypothetical protein
MLDPDLGLGEIGGRGMMPKANITAGINSDSRTCKWWWETRV